MKKINLSICSSLNKNLSFRFLSRYHLDTTSLPRYYHPILSPYLPASTASFHLSVSTFHLTPSVVLCGGTMRLLPSVLLLRFLSQDTPMFVHCPEYHSGILALRAHNLGAADTNNTAIFSENSGIICIYAKIVVILQAKCRIERK